jgi:hypothetical protein
MVRVSAYLAIGLLLSGCTDFDEPSAVDPTPILGCYLAPEAPTLSIQQEGVRIEEGPEVLPFRYQQEKVGMVLAIPMVASVGGGGFELKGGEEHSYRVLWTDAGPVIRVAFGPGGTVRDYQRHSGSPC